MSANALERLLVCLPPLGKVNTLCIDRIWVALAVVVVVVVVVAVAAEEEAEEEDEAGEEAGEEAEDVAFKVPT